MSSPYQNGRSLVAGEGSSLISQDLSGRPRPENPVVLPEHCLFVENADMIEQEFYDSVESVIFGVMACSETKYT